MAGVTCLGFLLCLWEPVQATLLSFLGTAVADCLACLRDQAVAQVRNLTSSWRNHQVELINASTAHLVGLEEIRGYLEKIVGYLKDDAAGIIGIYGMGGVGKTTLLLQTINNDFHKIGAPGFDVVIWVTVSKEDASILKIQKQIGDRLGLSLSADTAGSSSQAEEQAKVIFKAFSESKRRFLLLLDDVWEKLDLKHVGIPHPTAENNKCKIILTTRSKRVCINMGAEKLVNVNILNASESWKLFQKNLGTEVNLDDPHINPLARAVAGKCGGLPLALKTVGRAMAEANSVGEWQEALEQLRETPHKLPGMEDEVLSLLKFSFDRLGDESTKQCLLYCCLFPEDYEIAEKRLIEYSVGEGFLDDTQSDSIVRARNRGHGVITKLKSACLLESSSLLACVKMHDVVREMCLWLTGGEFDKNNTFLVYAGSDRVPRSVRWGEAKRISLMHNSSQALPHNIPSCPYLRTLLCNDFFRHCATIPGGAFFECMPALCVLDLSGSRLESLPVEISFLPELRYLDLCGTSIESLPRGLGKLAKLSQLDLDETFQLFHIPREAIPTLTGLRVLGMYRSGYDFNLLNESPDTSSSDGNMGEDSRSCWDRLEELRLSVRTLSSLEMLLKFDKLCSSTTRLEISLRWDRGITPARVCGALERLEKVRLLRVVGDGKESEVQLGSGNRFGSNLKLLELFDVPKITVVVSSPCFFESLRRLIIIHCHGIRDLMWVRQLPRLEEIDIFDCEGVEELLPEVNGGLEERGVDDEPVDCDRASLLSLKRIYLDGLPALKSISRRPLLFPSLEYLHVEGCPQLKKLPFGPYSAQNIRQISGERDWWESLEWHQDADGSSVKSDFLLHEGIPAGIVFER